MPRIAARPHPERAPGCLPAPLTSFVGRQVEIDKVAGLLAGHRLVTVTGPGGSGKTRLALEVARCVASRFADGVVWADFSGIDQAALVPGTLAVAVGVRQRPRLSMLESLVAGLAGRQLLLVLDNCEHLAAAMADTCERLLAVCDDLWVLATSTVALRVPGEFRLRVSPLPVPPPGGSLAQIAAAAAVVLFVDRVSATDPDFALTEHSAEVVAEIVRRLDGLPLAVELGAARATALGLDELRAGLDDRFSVLVGTNRGVPARQESLRAALDWSYGLLADAERRVYRRLAVFTGPFTLAAAVRVCGPQARVAVPRLVECSLLTAPLEGIDGRFRYRMLESMRAHADSLLSDRERTAAADGLLHWALAQDFSMQVPAYFTEQDYATVAWIDAERDNLRQAIDWASGRDPLARLRLEIAIGPWYVQRGRYGEGINGLQSAADQCPDRAPELAAACEFWLGFVCSRALKMDDAVARVTAAVHHAEAADRVTLVNCLAGSVIPLANTGRYADAANNAQRALALAQGHQAGIASAYIGQAIVSEYRGEYETALAMLDHAESALGMPTELMLQVRAACHLELGHVEAAEMVAQSGLALARRTDPSRHNEAEAWYVLGLAECYLQGGRIAEAAVSLAEGLRLARAHGMRMAETDGLLIAAETSVGLKRPYEAAVLLAAWRAAVEAAGMVDTAANGVQEAKLSKWAGEALPPEQLQAAQARGSCMAPAAAIELACTLATPTQASGPTTDARLVPKLSRRERELLSLVAQGATDAQIAEQLFISIRTVRSHLDRIRDKTGARRRADLTRLTIGAQLG